MDISIVIPNYNHAKYLGNALDHALAQTHPACEVIVIDDCSTDNSIPLIESYIAKSPLIRLIQNPKNMGLIHNINLGLEEAKGKYVLLSAADDWIEPNLLAIANDAFNQAPSAAFFSSAAWYVNEENPDVKLPMRMPYPSNHRRFLSPIEAKKFLYKLDSWFIGNTTIYYRELAISEGGFDAKLGSFTDNFFCRILALKYGCNFDPRRLATWRIRQSGFASVHNADSSKQTKILHHLEEILLKKHQTLCTKKLRARFLARYLFNIKRNLINSKGYIGKIQTLLLFCYIRPFDILLQLKIYLHGILYRYYHAE